MDQFKVEDLLIDFSKDVVDSVVIGGGGSDNFCASDNGGACGGSCTDSSAIIDSFSSTSNSNYSNSGGGGGYELNNCFSVVGPPAAAAAPSADYASNFSGDLCVPQDDFAELEWLSNFVDDQSSFSTEEDLHRLQLISGVKAGLQPDEGSDTNYGFHHEAHQPNFHQPPNSPPTFDPDMPVPGKARSKRSRASPGNWASSSLLMLSDTPGEPGPMESKKVVRAGQKRKQSGGGGSEGNSGPGEARKCLHCLTEKTPQWRTGPLGPKTLCNACGVRYKSGRLVPEYRPASSPTFVLAKHSNSHRKVMELRRQKELMRSQQIQQQQFLQSHQSMVFGLSNGDDYMIHQHVGPDFRRLI